MKTQHTTRGKEEIPHCSEHKKYYNDCRPCVVADTYVNFVGKGTRGEWEEEFDAKFVKKQSDSGQFVSGKPVEWQYFEDIRPEDIKSFIKDLLAKEREEVIGFFTYKDGTRYITGFHGDSDVTEEVINLIKSR